MAKLPFTKQELTRAWRDATAVSDAEPRQNPHRLLLFYAVECGLKAVFLTQRNLDIIDEENAELLSHDLNKIANLVLLPKAQLLPEGVSMKNCNINRASTPRNCHVSQLNQVWRYGGKLTGPGAITDQILEEKLLQINAWINKEL
ncbi:hypothetical protein LVW29_03400 [Klebsiella oxytoca]|uniref:hypothetical protein n=1 Tax=Klebsiella oxytoca TaxID=571 RepID=UPI0005158659|nr:hypothetical protein [Klebsiella oxytoca]MCE0403150.1 hypothetical protein [Klebsiella oxytoca]MDU5359746.1 hypothetical protein [Klebsiella oxytoca]HEC2088026.1 hypothetical protein [Klebsiella oxytoca]